jgi:hypothetical protein
MILSLMKKDHLKDIIKEFLKDIGKKKIDLVNRFLDIINNVFIETFFYLFI